MDKDTKVYFSIGIGYGESHKDEFTLEELGYVSTRHTDLEKFLEQEWIEWRANYLDGGWSFEEPL